MVLHQLTSYLEVLLSVLGHCFLAFVSQLLSNMGPFDQQPAGKLSTLWHSLLGKRLAD